MIVIDCPIDPFLGGLRRPARLPPTHMKTHISIFLFSLASAACLPAAVTITVANNVPNGSASGGSGTGAGLLSTTSGTIASNRGLPVTTYTVTGINLTSVGGTASESITFTVGYNGTTDGVNPGTPTFSTFGNVGVGTGGIVSGTETLTATIALTSSSFAGLTLTGFTKARAGGFSSGESGTFTWQGGGTDTVAFGDTVSNITGNFFTFAAIGASTLNIEGFEAQFSAVPEPASVSLLALGGISLLRRRRTA